MRLQPVIGNQAVMRLIQQQKQGLMTRPVNTASRSIAGVVQRDIGFEFEVPSSKTRMPNPKLTDGEKDGTVPLPSTAITTKTTRQGHTVDNPKTISPLWKQAIIIAGDNFELQADESSNGGTNMEFVMPRPVPETKEGRKSLDRTMKAILELCEYLVANPQLPHEAKDIASAGYGRAQLPPAIINVTAKITGNPQSTVAVRLEQLAKFMKDIGAPTDGSNPDLAKLDLGLQRPTSKKDYVTVGQMPDLAEQAIQNFRTSKGLGDDWGSSSLKGLLSLIFTYLKKGSTDDMDYPKLIAPLMARTDFSAMFSQVPEAAYFKARPKVWVDWILESLGMTGQKNYYVFTRGMRGEEFGPSRKEWLTEMLDGTDLLTQAASNEYFYMSMGKLGAKTEQVGQKKKKTQAPIFEMRRMTADVPYKEWRGLALDVFDYIYALNNMEKKANYSRKNRDKLNK